MTKRLLLIRITDNDKAIYGILLVIDKDFITFQCCALENKALSFTSGTYPIRFEYSPRFKTNLWELYDIPGRGEIKIHTANSYSQLEGCIAVGSSFEHLRIDEKVDDIVDVANSADTLDDLHNEMSGITESTITVIDIPA